MSSYFTKEELHAMQKEFLYLIGADVPEGRIKQAWARFMEVKKREKWQADLDALVEQGLVAAVYDERDGEWRYEPTEEGLVSAKRGELERLGV